VSGLSVVVPATDRPSTLARCTAALAASDDPPDEVIVVDGPPRLSAAGARNLGAARASGDVLVFVDADVEVHRDALTRVRAAFAAHPDLTAVYGSYDDTPGDRGTVSAFRNLLHHHVHQAGGGTAETFWTGLGAVRRSAFLATGGFDEDRYPHPSIEDIDLGHRLTAAGARVVLDPSIQGTHLKAWTLRSMLWTDFARRGVPWVALQLRNRRVSTALNCGWRHRLSAASCALGTVFAVLGLPLLAVAAVGALLGLNHGFYALLARQLGPVQALAGVALHGAHHLVSVVAVPVGLVAGLAAWAMPSRHARPAVVAGSGGTVAAPHTPAAVGPATSAAPIALAQPPPPVGSKPPRRPGTLAP
jgi:GT2 family glycosyltransferase